MAAPVKKVRGKRTGANLRDVGDCFAPWGEDAWGALRPPFSPQLAQLCAELSASCYDLDIARWLEAGWGDGSFQAENRVYGGFSGAPSRRFDPSKVLRSQLTLRRARSHMGLHPVGDTLRTVQQLFSTSTGKVLVLVYPVSENRFVVSVCFMGTSRKFYDWMTNLKTVCTPEGLHEGFFEVCRQFERNAEAIHFPDVASSLGVPDLTLAEVLTEARGDGSRFHLLITGHSQGGAVSQCYVHRLIHDYAVQPAHITCYTMASPTVAAAHWQGHPSYYPIYNLINADDYVPRTGASMRLGIDMVYHPNDAFRQISYQICPEDPEQTYALGRLDRILQHVQDTASAFEAIISLFLVLREQGKPLVVEVLTQLNTLFRFLPGAMQKMGFSVEDFLQLLATKVTSLYRDTFGTLPNQETVDQLAANLLGFIDEVGADRFTQSLSILLFAPHLINADVGKGETPLPAYIAMVRYHCGQLEPACWSNHPSPRALSPAGEQVLPLEQMVPFTLEPPVQRHLESPQNGEASPEDGDPSETVDS